MREQLGSELNYGTIRVRVKLSHKITRKGLSKVNHPLVTFSFHGEVNVARVDLDFQSIFQL